MKLAVTGGGPMEEELRAALPTAAFLGLRYGADLARIYASLDVFVHTGPHETFGQTIQEASASGLPVVAPASGGPLDLVDDGGSPATWCAPGDAGRAVGRGARAGGRPGAAGAAWAAAARRRVLARSWSALTDELLGHYEAVIDSGALAARLAA